jgi:hypothetical protein
MNARSAAGSKYLGPVGLCELLHALLLRDERLGLPHSIARSVDHAAVHLGKFTGGASLEAHRGDVLLSLFGILDGVLLGLGLLLRLVGSV